MSWSSRELRPTLVWLAPGIFAVIYGAVVVASLRPIVTAINMDSDAVVAPVMAQLLGAAPAGSHVALGNHPWYEALLFLRATSGLAGHRQLWDVAPLLWSLGGLAILGWASWRSLGARAAVLTVAALACLGSFGRFVFFTFIWHGLTAFHTIIVCAALVAVTPRLPAMRWWAIVLTASALGAFGALALASDDLFALWALLPLVGTAALAAWRTSGPGRTRLLGFALVSSGVSLVAGEIIGAVMRAHGYVASPFPISFVAADHLIGNFVLLIESYAKLAGGDFFGAQVSGASLAEFVSGALVITVLVLVVLEVRKRARQPRRCSEQHVSRRFAFISFWAMSLILTSAAFLLSSAPEDPYDGRYLLGGYVALGALLPLLAERSATRRAVVTGGVCLFGLSAIYQVVNRPFDPGNTFPGPGDATALVQFSRRENVSLGYAGYWDAADLTWGTHFKVTLYPTWECASAHRLCTFPWVGVSSWYTPRPRRRSLLVLDSSQPGVRGLDLSLGRPLASTRIGNLSVYAFPYDIAVKLIPARLSPAARPIIGAA